LASFSNQTKQELARLVPTKACCRMAELAALLRMEGLVVQEGGDMAFTVGTENAAVARKVYKLGKSLFDLEASFTVQRKRRLRKNNVYTLCIPRQPSLAGVLTVLGIGGLGERASRYQDLKRQCCRRAYLRGAFLGGGSLSSPRGGTYHLEMVTQDAAHAGLVQDLMTGFGLAPKTSQRKRRQVVYLKDSEQIADFLKIIGANNALLDFENVRVVKGMRNSINRLVNCETANLSKAVEAGMRQAESVRLIRDTIGLEGLPASLREVALLRLEYPEASLKELGEMLSTRISKSGVNHRLRRLEELAQELADKDSGRKD